MEYRGRYAILGYDHYSLFTIHITSPLPARLCKGTRSSNNEEEEKQAEFHNVTNMADISYEKLQGGKISVYSSGKKDIQHYETLDARRATVV